jgi:hypothetical protein
VLAQRVIADAGAEAAVGEHAVDAHTGVLGLGDRAAEQAVIAGVAALGTSAITKASAVSAMRALGAQPGIGRAADIGLHHRRVDPQPPRAQRPALDRQR